MIRDAQWSPCTAQYCPAHTCARLARYGASGTWTLRCGTCGRTQPTPKSSTSGTFTCENCCPLCVSACCTCRLRDIPDQPPHPRAFNHHTLPTTHYHTPPPPQPNANANAITTTILNAGTIGTAHHHLGGCFWEPVRVQCAWARPPLLHASQPASTHGGDAMRCAFRWLAPQRMPVPLNQLAPMHSTRSMHSMHQDRVVD